MKFSRFSYIENLSRQVSRAKACHRLIPAALIIMILLLSSCSAAATPAPEAAAPEAPAAIEAPAEAPAAAPAFTAPAVPVLAGTNIPPSSARITARSAAQVDLLAVWGSAPFDQALYSPNGRWIAAATSPGVRLYEAASLSPAGYLNSSDTITSMAFTPDSALLITGTQTGMLRAWDMVQRTPVVETPIQAGTISGLAIAPGGNLLAASAGQALLLYDLRSRAVIDLQASAAPPTSLSFSPAGDLLAVGTSTGSVDLWSTGMGAVGIPNLVQLNQAGQLPGAVTQVAFAPALSQGQPLLGAAAQDGSVQAWRLTADGQSVQPLGSWREANDSARSLAFSPSGDQLAYGYTNGRVYLRRLADASQPVQNLVVDAPPFASLAFAPDGGALATASTTLQLWDTQSGSLQRGLEEVHHQPLSLLYSPDGLYLLIGTQQGGVEMYNAANGILVRTLSASGSPVASLAASPDSRLLASGDKSGVIQLWSMSDGAPMATIPAHAGAVTDLEFSPDGASLASAGQDNQVRLWNPADGSPLAILPGDPQPGAWVTGLAYAPDGATLAAGSSSGLVRFWIVNPLPDPILATPVREMPAGGPLAGLAFLPAFAASFPTLVTLNQGGQLALWNAQDGSLQYSLAAVSPSANSLALSPTGDVAGIAAQSGPALVDLGTYATSYPAGGRVTQAISAAFSPNGLLLATAMEDGTIRIWGVL